MENWNNEKVAAITLGINDSLIELTGVLVGLSFALNNHNLVALAGLITGVAASLSMAASAYMHARQEVNTDAAITGIYTGISYLAVVALLIVPYFVFSNIHIALLAMMIIALTIIALMCWYSARHRKSSFWKELGTMLIFSLGVATVSFLIGQGLRRIIKVEI